MAEESNYSTKEMLVKLSAQKEEGFNADNFYQMVREIEVNMEDFDQNKRKQAAQAVEDLSKLVITS